MAAARRIVIQPAAQPGRPAPRQPEKPAARARKPAARHTPMVLRFSPTAWAKLLYFRDRQETEVGGFGVLSADDLLRVEEFVTVRQAVSMASVCFDDQAVADFFEAQVDAGRKPEQFCRVWLHTHPGNCPQPSSTDEETFARVFGGCQWAVMFVLAQEGKTYARLRFNVGPGASAVVPVDVDYGQPFGASDAAAWEREYRANILPERLWGASDDGRELKELAGPSEPADLTACSVPDDWMEELEAMEPAERQLILDELAARPDLWGDEREVTYG